jgi:hypothetical protein
MRTNRDHITMDGNEAKLLDRYEAQFGETPPLFSTRRHPSDCTGAAMAMKRASARSPGSSEIMKATAVPVRV